MAGIVVHVTAGFSALASLIVVGKRQVSEEDLEDSDPALDVLLAKMYM